MADKNEELIDLKINCCTWLKETEDLFDFETSNTTSNNYSISSFDKENYIIKFKDESDEKQKEKLIIIHSNLLKQKLLQNDTTKIVGAVKFDKSKSNFRIINAFKTNHLNYSYFPSNCERFYQLFPLDQYVNIEEGDIVKIGRIRMKFDKISFKSKNKNLYDVTLSNNVIHSTQFNDVDTVSANKIMGSSIIEQSTLRNYNDIYGKVNCRLCYQSESDINDPLVSPCNCSGSMKYIHLSCLKNSIKLKVHTKQEEFYQMILFHNYCCEICLSMYPKYITYKSKVYYLIDIDLNKFENYVLCDLTQYVDNNQKLSHIGYLMFKIDEGMELSLGRKKNNHIKLKDISVSRNHCTILKKNNNLYMKDTNSKFGTMKYIQNYLEINIDQNTKILSGKHELELSVVKSWSMFGISSIFKFACCTCNQPCGDSSELIIYEEEKLKRIKINESALNKNKESNKEDYYSKFKDYDSYNDYIINMEYILGVNPLIFSGKKLLPESDCANENTNNQNKDKEESYTNC